MKNYFWAAFLEVTKDLPRGWRAALSRNAEINKSYLTNVIKGIVPPPLQEEVRRKIAKGLGYHDYDHFLSIGRAKVEGKPIPELPGNSLTPDELRERGFLSVSYSKNMQLAAGSGGEPLGYVEVDLEAKNSPVVVYSPEIFPKTKNRSARDLQAFRVGGDSMEPEIAKGGIVIVDKAHGPISNLPKIKEGSVYMLCYDPEGVCSVKRLSWAKKHKLLSIESTNKDYKPEFKEPKEIYQLIGKVVWTWRGYE